MNYLQFPQSKMQITAKITKILSTKNSLTTNELQKQHSPQTVTEALLRYGMAHQNELICRVSARNKINGLLVTGYFKMGDVMGMVNSQDYQVMEMMPYGIFLDGFDYHQRVLREEEGQLIEKVGVILRKKVRARLASKDNKPGLVKKQSQASTNAQTDKNKKPAGHPNKEQPLHSKTLNIETKKQPQHKKQNPFSQAAKTKPETAKPVKPAQTKRELKIASEPESEDEQKILEQFNISAPPRLVAEKVEGMGKIEEEVKMRDVERKIEEIDFDEEDAFELMLKKKGKVEIKAENKNTNFPQKIEKKTTEKLPNPAPKPKPAQSQAEPKKSQAQPTLFGFMNKKMAP